MQIYLHALKNENWHIFSSLGWSDVWRRASERLLHVNGYSIYLHLEKGETTFNTLDKEKTLDFSWFIQLNVAALQRVSAY